MAGNGRALYLVSVETQDARAAMQSLIEARALSIREEDPEYPAKLAELAWKVADAMRAERWKRARG